jgi:hypothetical protein
MNSAGLLFLSEQMNGRGLLKNKAEVQSIKKPADQSFYYNGIKWKIGLHTYFDHVGARCKTKQVLPAVVGGIFSFVSAVGHRLT